MGMLFRTLAPKPLKKARRAAHPVSLLTPRPVRKAKMTAINVTHPTGAAKRAAKREVVRTARGANASSGSGVLLIYVIFAGGVSHILGFSIGLALWLFLFGPLFLLAFGNLANVLLSLDKVSGTIFVLIMSWIGLVFVVGLMLATYIVALMAALLVRFYTRHQEKARLAQLPTTTALDVSSVTTSSFDIARPAARPAVVEVERGAQRRSVIDIAALLGTGLVIAAAVVFVISL
jgi:hypothetical protein